MSSNYLMRFVKQSMYGDDFRYPIMTILTERFHRMTAPEKMTFVTDFVEACPEVCECDNGEVWLNTLGLRAVMTELYPMQPTSQMLVWLDEIEDSGW
jgi:hypothetical protein